MAAPGVRRVIKVPLIPSETRAAPPPALRRETTNGGVRSDSAVAARDCKPAPPRPAAATIPTSPLPMVFHLEGFEDDFEAGPVDPVTDSATHARQAVERLLTPGPGDTAVSVLAGSCQMASLPSRQM
jgi:hypothetical protein